MPSNTFIGRQAELQRLAAFLQKAAGGQLQVAFISGEAGAGKSYLAEEFLREQQESDSKLVVAVGQCNAQIGASDPYLPFRQILTSLTTGTEQDKNPSEADKAKRSTALREFVRVSSQTLIQLGPDLIGIFVPGGSFLARLPTLIATNSKLADKLADRLVKKTGKEPAKVDPALDQEKIFEQYAAVLKALAHDHTLILFLDDLQWADRGSLDLLFHLARQLKDCRILLLGTFRPDDVALGRDGDRHPFESILNELKRYFGDIVLDLSRSDPVEGRAFTDALIDSEPNHLEAAFREKLFALTDGHPLFTVELLRNLQERGSLVKDGDGCWIAAAALDWSALPARVEGVIGERIARLPVSLHESLNTASVMGFEFVAQVVARVEKREERELVRDLSRDLEKRYRLVLEGREQQVGTQLFSSWHFSHAILQQYLYGELAAAERRLLHGDVAAALEALAGEAAGDVALQLARHYDEAGNAGKAVHYWILAGDAAFAVYAQSEAIAAYSRALELGKSFAIEPAPLQHLYARRGRAMELNGQFEQALQNYDEMLAAARARQDRRMELDAMVAASTLYSTPTAVVDAARGQALSEQTLKLAEELGDQAVQSRVLWNLLLASLLSNNAPRAIEYGERSLSIARALNLREQMAYTLSDLGWACNVACRFDESEKRLEEGAALWQELGNRTMLTDNLNSRLFGLYWRGLYDKALPIAQQSLEISRDTKNIWNQCWPRHLLGLIHFEYGEMDTALEDLEASVHLAKEANTPLYVIWYSAALSGAYLSLGAVQKGMDLFRSTRVPIQDIPMSPGRAVTLSCYALFEIATGQLDEAAASLDDSPLAGSVWDSSLNLARGKLALARNDAAQAASIAEALTANARRLGLGLYLPQSLFLQGTAYLMQGRRDVARSALEDASAAAEAVGSRHLLYQILAALLQMAPDDPACAAWKTRGRAAVDFIADHMTQDGYRAAFLQLPDVRILLA